MIDHDLVRTMVKSQVAVVVIVVGSAACALASGNWWWLACSIAVGIASQLHVAFTIAAAILSCLVGAWPAFITALFAVGAEVLMRMRVRPGLVAASLDQQALTDAVLGLPASLTRELSVDSPVVVDTAALVRAAVMDDPSRWPRGLASVSGNSEGGLVTGTRWTVVAAEAALVSEECPDRGAQVDIHTLAGIATTIPHSLAGVMVSQAAKKRVLMTVGLGLVELTRMSTTASRKPGGELMLHRLELTTKSGAASDGLLHDAEWDRLVHRSTARKVP